VDVDTTNPERNSQSVNPSEESSRSFLIRVPSFFPFFTRDKESKLGFNEENREGGRRDATQREEL